MMENHNKQTKIIVYLLYTLTFWLSFAFSPICAETTEEETDNSQSETKDWQDHFNEGIQAYDNAEFAEALAHFGRAELESSESEMIHFNMGLAHLGLGEFDLAKDELTKALSSYKPLIKLKAQYNLGHLHYLKALVPTTESGTIELNEEELAESIKYFRDVKSAVKFNDLESLSEAKKIADDASANERIIIAKLKMLSDQKAKKKGGKVPFIQGTVQINGRPVDNAFIYMKSKWENRILGHSKSDTSGTFKLEELDIGKYQLAGSLYKTDLMDDINFGSPIKIPTYKEDKHDIKLQGLLSHACPYQSSANTLDVPYNDSSRSKGPMSITRSTDWGELTDGRPDEHFPEDNDIHPGYVSFDQPHIQIAMALPQKANQAAHSIQQSTAPQEKPTFSVQLKGFHNSKDVVHPQHFQVFGMKQGLDKPVRLYQTIIKTTQQGKYNWKSEEFEYQDCRNLIFSFARMSGQRMSFHEIEVYEKDPNQDNKQDQKQDQKKDDQQKQDDQKDQKQNDQKKQKKKDQVSRSTKNILSKVRKKNDDEKKKKQQAIRATIQTDKDY